MCWLLFLDVTFLMPGAPAGAVPGGRQALITTNAGCFLYGFLHELFWLSCRPDAKNALYLEAIKRGDLLLNRVQKLSRVIDVD